MPDGSAALTELQRRVLDAIPRGRKNVKSAKKIAAEAGTTPETTEQPLRAIIRELNLLGHPIVSTSHGFWVAERPEEVAAYRESLERRRSSLEKRIAFLKGIEEQMRRTDSGGEATKP